MACTKAQNRPEIPFQKRQTITYPCKIHGDPRNPPPEVLIALWLYVRMPRRQHQTDDGIVSQPEIEVKTLETLLKWLGLRKSQLFYLWLLEEVENVLNE